MLRDTKISKTVPRRGEIAEVLEQLVYDLGDLAAVVRTAHWNVKGPRFLELHEFFGDAAERLYKGLDKVAERAVQLGCHADGGVREAAKCSRLPGVMPGALQDESRGIAPLISRYGVTAGFVGEGVNAALKIGDAVTADMLTGVLRKLDEDLWKMESM